MGAISKNEEIKENKAIMIVLNGEAKITRI